MPLLCSFSFPVLRRWQISDIVKEKISGSEEEVKKVGELMGRRRHKSGYVGGSSSRGRGTKGKGF